jgi:diacylglycerol kinase family enzyme
MTNDPIEATGELLAALSRRSLRRVGLGSANGRYFLFHVGIGFDAAVVEQVERRSALKRYAGHPLFIYATVATWLRHYDRSRPRFAVRTGSTDRSPGQVVDDAYFAICQNTHPYTFLGNRPLDVAPSADLDSRLSLLVLRTLRLAPTSRIIAAALRGRGGSHLAHHRWAVFADDVADLSVTGYGPFPYQMDGDFLGETEHLALRWERDTLTLVMPAGPNPPRDELPGTDEPLCT